MTIIYVKSPKSISIALASLASDQVSGWPLLQQLSIILYMVSIILVIVLYMYP